jgi:alkane 1-monooxygenase
MLDALPFTFGYLLPAVTALGLSLGGGWAWSTVLFVFVLTPLLDALVPVDVENPEPEEEGARAANPWFDVLLFAWLPVQVVVMLATAARVAGGGTPLEIAGWIVSLGVTTGGGGITVAHELMHRRAPVARAWAEVLMTLVLYPHFCIEHVLGHHRHVATPRDPASARRGESVWRFLPRTVGGGLLSAWRLETERVRAKGVRGLADRRLRHPLLVLALFLGSGLFGGATALGVLFGQAAVAILLLEVVNYIEHYGLERRPRRDGRFERVRPEHSWNSAHRITSWYIFNLNRHSDHHYLASRPYPLLRHFDEAPQLPAGYPSMVLLALVPPLWRAVMDPRVDAWNASTAT